MTEILINLSGKTGLADGHSGDKDMVTPRPETRQSNELNQFVSGLFNPYLREGYLAPIVTTQVNVTATTAPASQFIASEYDQVGKLVYWADNQRNLFLGSDLNDTSLTKTLALEAADVGTYPDRAYDKLYDLQLYQINGERKMFYVGQGLTYGPASSSIQVGTQSSISTYGLLTTSILPSGTTTPTIVSKNRAFLSGSNLSVPFTVAGGTNRGLFAIAITRTSGALAGATWRDSSGTPSYPMSVAGAGSGNGFFWEVYKLANPLPVTTGEVRFFVNVSADRIVYIFETTNTNQVQMVDATFNTSDTAALLASVKNLYKNQLDLVAGYLDIGTQPLLNSTYVALSLEAGLNTYGSDFLYQLKPTTYGLQVGIANLDLTLGNAANPNWLFQRALGGFTHSLPNDYAFMRTADNGFAYIFAGNRVHKIDGSTLGGTTGTVTKDVLLFPEYFQLTDAVDYRSSLYMVVHQYPVSVQSTDLSNYLGKCGVYVWNRISTQLNRSDYIELPGVREIKKIYTSPDGVLKLITISDNGTTELRQFGYNDSGGVVFPVVRELGIGAHPKIPDGATVSGDKTIWLGNDGNLYCEKRNSLSKIFQVKPPGTTSSGLAANIEAGAILYGSSSETADAGFRSNKQGIFISYSDSGIQNKKIYPFDLKTGANTPQSINQGDVYTGVTYIPITSVARSLRIYNLPITGTGTDVVATVKIYFNQGTNAVRPGGMTKSITKDEAKRGYVDFHLNTPYIHAIQIEVEWNDTLTLGDDTYLPSVAIITHEPTSTQSPDNG